MTRRIVVVGSGMATTRLVEGLVARGVAERDRVTVLGDERHAPYNRILLSAVLEGTHRPEALTLRPPAWYAAHGVELWLGARVLEVDRGRREVMLVDGRTFGYDVLVLGTGSIPSLPPIRGLVRMDGTLHPAVHAFRSLEDCLRLDAAVRPLAGPPSPAEPPSPVEPVETPSPVEPVETRRGRAVVVGGGLLGLQVARALAVRGLDVELVEGGAHLLRSQVGPQAGRIIARDLARLGTAVYTGARAVRLTDAGLRLDNGCTLSADLVVLTAGGRPATALARRAGLVVRRGIVVDDRLTTSDPAVHALGDCVEHAGQVTGFVPPAWDQAQALAALLAGEDVRYPGARTVARLRATDLDVAVLGDPETAQGEVVEVTNPVVGSHRKLVVHEGVVVAATLVGDLSRIGLITQHYDRGTVLGPAEPGELLLADRPTRPTTLPDDAEACTCAGVTAGAVRACSSLEHVRETTRATTGCGGCAATVRQLLATRPALTPT